MGWQCTGPFPSIDMSRTPSLPVVPGSLKGAFVLRMPLDSVDLAIFAQLDVQILLFQLFQPALRVGAGEILHLLTHGGMWAPLPSSKHKKNRTCAAVSLRSTASGALWHIWQGRALAFSAMMWRTIDSYSCDMQYTVPIKAH
ncbi:unnamed protein product [Durusdinium trenchii]|uniref:Uncharacterized protein n=1 Tax=Durusdinium trenchii TaxID=1381693 RepID=A0ABP0MDM9_9DINO